MYKIVYLIIYNVHNFTNKSELLIRMNFKIHRVLCTYQSTYTGYTYI